MWCKITKFPLYLYIKGFEDVLTKGEYTNRYCLLFKNNCLRSKAFFKNVLYKSNYQRWNRVGSRFVRVNRVRAGLKIIRVWPRLNHVRHEIKESTIWEHNDDWLTFGATPTFQRNDICLLQMYGELCPFFLLCIRMRATWPYSTIIQVGPLHARSRIANGEHHALITGNQLEADPFKTTLW